jgi:hypothetical protein
VTAPAYTEQALRDRLLEIADNPAFDGIVQHLALFALMADAVEEGFAITPPDLSDDAIRDALAVAQTDRYWRLRGEAR